MIMIIITIIIIVIIVIIIVIIVIIIIIIIIIINVSFQGSNLLLTGFILKNKEQHCCNRKGHCWHYIFLQYQEAHFREN